MIPTSKLKHKGIAKLHRRSASIGLLPRNLSGGGQLGGSLEVGRIQLR